MRRALLVRLMSLALLSFGFASSAHAQYRDPCQGDWACPQGQQCVDGYCQTPQASEAQAPAAAPSGATPDPGVNAGAEPDEQRPRRRPLPTRRRQYFEQGRRRGSRLGLINSFYVGMAGAYKNPRPAHSIGADLAFPTSDVGRYHFEIAYQQLNGHGALRLNPIGIGFGTPLFARDKFEFELEIIAALVQVELYPESHFTAAASSALKAQVIFGYDIGFIAAQLVGVEIRYLEGISDVAIFGGFGANWPFAITVGVEL